MSHENFQTPQSSEARLVLKNKITTQAPLTRDTTATMLDINDFITERGGDPKKIKESQRRRHAPEEAVDEVIAMFEDHRKSRPCLMRRIHHLPKCTDVSALRS